MRDAWIVTLEPWIVFHLCSPSKFYISIFLLTFRYQVIDPDGTNGLRNMYENGNTVRNGQQTIPLEKVIMEFEIFIPLPFIH